MAERLLAAAGMRIGVDYGGINPALPCFGLGEA